MEDTPGGTTIHGLPSCKGLEVVKVNCAVKVIQDTSCLPGPTPNRFEEVEKNTVILDIAYVGYYLYVFCQGLNIKINIVRK